MLLFPGFAVDGVVVHGFVAQSRQDVYTASRPND